MIEPKATDKQRGYIWFLCRQTSSSVPANLDSMGKDEAGRVIGELKQKIESRKRRQADHTREVKRQQRAKERAERPYTGSPRPEVRRGSAAIKATAEPWAVEVKGTPTERESPNERLLEIRRLAAERAQRS